jgi:[NiFe] hydrogenase diaphorase moiety large subunit
VTQLCAALGVQPGEPRADARVCVDLTSCTGMCDQGPAALVNGFALTRLDAERIRRIAALVEADTPLVHWPRELFAVSNNVEQPGLLLSDLQPREAGLEALLARGPDTVLAALAESGLRGRGGAGFATADKWRSCRDAAGTDKVVVCNADEGEPGTFKDRVLLAGYADLVVEGMTIAAGVVGASQGFVYLRGEYRPAPGARAAGRGDRRSIREPFGQPIGRKGRLRLRHPHPPRRRRVHLRRGIGPD